MSAAPSSSWKSGGGVSDQFPAGLRVLVVDDDPLCLRILEKMLQNCHYQPTTCNKAEIALEFLRDNKNGFDVVISDVHMPDMDGFKLLEQVGLEMDLPVIMMSADDSKDVVMKGVTHGACDYLIKPVRNEALKNIWQHVVRKMKYDWKDNDVDQSESVEDGERQQNPSLDVDYSSSPKEENCRSSKRRKDEEDEAEGGEKDDTCSMKKPRVVWSVELHQQFVGAVNQLGLDKAVPKKILELMNVPGLTRENVASHLQKYRLYLRRLNGVSQHHNATFGSLSSFSGSVSAKIPPQSLVSLQTEANCRTSTKISILSRHMDQRNFFSFEGPKLISGEGQSPLGSNSKIANLQYGTPTNMEPKKVASLNQSAQSFRSMNMKMKSQANQSGPLLMPMAQPSEMHEKDGSQVLRLPSSMVQTFASCGIASEGLGHSGFRDGIHGTIYPPVGLSPSLVDFSVKRGLEFPVKESGGFAASYEYFNRLKQHKDQNWGSYNAESIFNASQHRLMQESIHVSPEKLVQPGFSSLLENGQNMIRDTNISGEGGYYGDTDFGLPINPLLDDNSQMTVEELPDDSCPGNFFSQLSGQEDVLNLFLKQQQESFGSVGEEFGLNGYPLGNLPV